MPCHEDIAVLGQFCFKVSQFCFPYTKCYERDDIKQISSESTIDRNNFSEHTTKKLKKVAQLFQVSIPRPSLHQVATADRTQFPCLNTVPLFLRFT